MEKKQDITKNEGLKKSQQSENYVSEKVIKDRKKNERGDKVQHQDKLVHGNIVSARPKLKKWWKASNWNCS